MIGPWSTSSVDEVDRHAGDLDAGVEGVADGVGSSKRREQGRVGVEDSVREAGHRFWAENAHESGQDDGLCSCALRDIAYGMGKRSTIGMVRPVDDLSWNRSGIRPLQGLDPPAVGR